jgi:hypothetical protein
MVKYWYLDCSKHIGAVSLKFLLYAYTLEVTLFLVKLWTWDYKVQYVTYLLSNEPLNLSWLLSVCHADPCSETR